MSASCKRLRSKHRSRPAHLADAVQPGLQTLLDGLTPDLSFCRTERDITVGHQAHCHRCACRWVSAANQEWSANASEEGMNSSIVTACMTAAIMRRPCCGTLHHDGACTGTCLPETKSDGVSSSRMCCSTRASFWSEVVGEACVCRTCGCSNSPRWPFNPSGPEPPGLSATMPPLPAAHLNM